MQCKAMPTHVLCLAAQEMFAAERQKMRSQYQAFLLDCTNFKAEHDPQKAEQQSEQHLKQIAAVQARTEAARASCDAVQKQLQEAKRSAGFKEAECKEASMSMTGDIDHGMLRAIRLACRTVAITRRIAAAGLEGSLAAEKDRQRRLQAQLALAEAARTKRNKENEQAECAAVMIQEAIAETAAR
jgi:hypothetical protein